jgi:hypothetical protein
MAELTNQPMSKIVNWFMLLIIFVFDPLAIAMVVAANMAFAQVKGVPKDPKKYEVFKEKIVTKEVPVKKEVIKWKYNSELKELRKKINHPRIQNAIKHAKRAGDWDF